MIPSNSNITVKEFVQIRGDYPDKVATYSFSNTREASNFIAKNYSQFQFQKNINKWPIEQISNKGLFGKKNEYIWEAKNSWNEEWEIKFSKWILENVDVDFFKRYNISTDCADVAVALRWIFARINYLPQANTIAETGDLFGHYSLRKKWKKLKTASNWYEDELFKTALEFMLDQTSTQTVGNDAYPVNLDKESLIPGTFHLYAGNNSGHVKVILESHFDEMASLPIYTGASTMPRKVRTLAREVFNDKNWPYYVNDKEVNAFMAFRWTKQSGDDWVLEKKENHKRYSIIQFDKDLRVTYPSFIKYLIETLSPKIEEDKLIVEGIKDITDYINQRISIVDEGYNKCKTNKCQPNSSEYDDYSTPSRDSKLIKKFQDMYAIVKQVAELNSAPDLVEDWQNEINANYITIENHQLSLKQIYYLFSNQLTSFDPNDSKLKRWGLENEKYILDLIELLKNDLVLRDEKIKRLDSLKKDTCFPKDNCFIEYNTYHIDNNLKNNYVKLLTYCSLDQSDFCNQKLSGAKSSILNLNGEAKILDSWVKDIPFYNSDPRASLGSKWGKTNSGHFYFQNYENLQISSNQLAVVDYKKLIDLKNNLLIYAANSNQRIFIEKNGLVFLIDDLNKSIFNLNIGADNSISLVKFYDPDNLMQLDFKKRISPIYNGDKLIFKINLENNHILFRLNNKIEYIDEFNKNYTQNNNLISLIRNENDLSFIDLDQTKVFNFTQIDHQIIPELKYLSFVKYQYPNLIMQYSDQQRTLHYPVIFNLENNIYEKFDMNLNANCFMKFANLTTKQFIIETEHFSSAPKLNFFQDNNLVSTMGSFLIDIKEDNQKTHFILGFGIPWEATYKTIPVVWNNNSTPSILSTNYDHYLYFIGNFAYHTKDFVGKILNLSSGEESSFIFGLQKKLNDYSLSINDKSNTTYYFNTNYGDYAFYSSTLKNDPNSTIPTFTFNNWFNLESIDDQIWSEQFNQAKVYSGNLTTIGRNFSIWYE